MKLDKNSNKEYFNLSDFGKEAPRFSFSRTLNKIVFGNKEAYYLCVIAIEQPTVLDGVPFKCDDEFKKHVAEELKIENGDLKYSDIKLFIQKNIIDALSTTSQLGDDSYKMFNVDLNDPNNVHKMNHMNSKGKKHQKQGSKEVKLQNWLH